jgi:hypothetical protein
MANKKLSEIPLQYNGLNLRQDIRYCIQVDVLEKSDKKMKYYDWIMKDLWDTIKRPNLQIMGIAEEMV